MDLATIRTNLTALKSFRSVILPIEDTLKKIRFDHVRSKSAGWAKVALVDFRDVFRYLHPTLDYSAYYENEAFCAEQVALEYAFSRRPFKLYMLSEYLEEYRLTLRSAHMQMVDFALAPDDHIKERVIRLDRDVAALVDKLRGTGEHRADGERDGLRRFDEPFLDYLFDNVRADILKGGVARFRQMLDDDIIKSASEIEGIESDDLVVTTDDRYEKLLGRLQSVRPGRKKPNEIDAKAFYLVNQLNRKYYSLRKLFLFVTSSRSVISAFDGLEAVDCLQSRDLFENMDEVSVIRTPAYFLLRFFLQSQEFTKLTLDVDGFTDLVARYSTVTHRLQDYFDRAIGLADVTDHSFLRNYEEAIRLRNQLRPFVMGIGQFGASLSGAGSLYKVIQKRLELPSVLSEGAIELGKIRKKITAAVDDPKIVVSHFSNTAQRLNRAISDLEQGLVPLMYKSKAIEFIYPIHTLNSQNKKVSKTADAIVDLLSRQDEQSFTEAFKKLSDLRSEFPTLSDTYVLSSKVYRAIGAYRDALGFALKAVEQAPLHLEGHFELALGYRKIAVSEQDYSLLTQAWRHCQVAKEIDALDPRVLREVSYLMWLAKEGIWSIPDQSFDVVERLIALSREALGCSESRFGKRAFITITIMNDLAYFLADSGDPTRLHEAEQLSRDALSAPDEIPSGTIAATKDTLGYVLMKKYVSSPVGERDSSLLDEAARLIREAYRFDKTRKVRQRHFEEVMDLVLELRLVG